jgi:hypothetical protein
LLPQLNSFMESNGKSFYFTILPYVREERVYILLDKGGWGKQNVPGLSSKTINMLSRTIQVSVPVQNTQLC